MKQILVESFLLKYRTLAYREHFNNLIFLLLIYSATYLHVNVTSIFFSSKVHLFRRSYIHLPVVS